LESIADNEVGRVNPKIPEMKENIRPASARPDKPETAVAGLPALRNRKDIETRSGCTTAKAHMRMLDAVAQHEGVTEGKVRDN
jgi:hypothetical protein